jgi:uncharacterized repeat protein (TIGR01451 family)
LKEVEAMLFFNTKITRFIVLFMLIILLAITFVPSHPSRAATTITVSTAAELIQAINDANSEAGLYVGADTITLSADITLTAVDNVTDGDNGLPSITSEITIEGNGFTIQRGDVTWLCDGTAPADFRILHMSVGGILSLNNVTIANGCAFAVAFGGGLFNAGGSIALISNSTFVVNTAYVGGGIANAGTITTISDSTFDTNFAFLGGGIGNGGAITTISSSTFFENDAFMGGGIGNDIFGGGGTISTISNSIFDGNWAGFGGGIDNGLFGGSGTITTISDSIFFVNYAFVGGGGIGNGGTIDNITNSTFDLNWTDDVGGGIANVNTINTISNNTFLENDAFNVGGGIANAGTISSISNNTFFDNWADYGGAIENVSTINNISGNTFDFNWADYGGAIDNDGTISSISNSTFSDNDADYDGGGLYNAGTITSINHTTFYNNWAIDFGGGIYNDATGTMNIANSILASGLFGGDCVNAGTIGSNINNLIEDNSCTPAFSGDPSLGPLADNGGPTQTHALLIGSSAIDKGDSGNCLPTDQRGAARPIDGDGTPNFPFAGDCDIGAYEYGANIGTLSMSVDVTSINENPAGTATVSVTVNNPDMVSNLGSDVVVYLTLSATAQDGSDYTTTFTSLLTFATPAPGISTQTFTITALVDALLEAPETVTITINGFSGPVILGTNLQTVTIISYDVVPVSPPAPQIGIFDPAISKLGILHPGQVGVTGEQLEWIVTVSNVGTVAGNNVVVTDTLVAALQIDSVDAPGATVNISGQTVTVNYTTINPGEVFQFSIWTTVLNGATVVNTACVADPTQTTGQECVIALPVSALPSTGEVPDN